MTDIATKGRALADRMRDMHGAVSKGLDELAVRIDDTEKAIPIAFDRAHNFIDAQQESVTEIDDVLKALSNLPLEGVAGVGTVLSTSQAQQAQPPAATPQAQPATQPQAAILGVLSTTPATMAPVPGSENLPSGIPANIAAALNNKGE